MLKIWFGTYSELNAIKQQSSELSEAERLERQATELRERAVAHGKCLLHPQTHPLILANLTRSWWIGAHPDNSKLGGGGGGMI